MPGFDLDLASGSDSLPREAWEALVRQALGGAPPEQLAARYEDGLIWPALGTRRDWPDGACATPLATPAAIAPWDIRAFCAVDDVGLARAALEAALQGGATSAFLSLTPDGDPARMEALLPALSRFKSLALDAGPQTLACGEALARAFQGSTMPELVLSRDIFAATAANGRATNDLDSALRQAAARIAKLASNFPSLTAAGIDLRPYHDAGASPALELAAATAAGVAYLRALVAAGMSEEAAARQIEFLAVADADFLLSLARIRALRRLWTRVLEACAIKGAARICAITSERMMTRRAGETNILRTAIASFAAAAGGAEAITILPHTLRSDPHSAEAARLAIDIQHILIGEAGIGRVADPACGSFTAERMSEDLAERAWSLFQEIEGKGGIAGALASGALPARIAEAREQRRVRIARRQTPITAITDYPVLEEAPLGKEMASAVATQPGAIPPLGKHYLDEDFERLRAASDRHLAATGERPRIYLAPIGTPADYGARAGFAAALFESGGIAVQLGRATLDAGEAASAFLDSGLAIAALVSCDALYAEKALAFAYELKQAGARYLYYFGRPGALEEALLDAGVGAFFASGDDAVELLRRAHELLGLS